MNTSTPEGATVDHKAHEGPATAPCSCAWKDDPFKGIFPMTNGLKVIIPTSEHE